MLWFISIRYFMTHRRQSLVCIAGVAISVMMFICTKAMMEGFIDQFIIETVESSGHITIYDTPRQADTPILEKVYPDPNGVLVVRGVKPREQVQKIKNPEGLLGKLRRLKGIIAVAPEVNGDAIVTYGSKTMSVAIIGVDPDQQVRVTTIGEKLLKGNFMRLKSTASGVLLGSGVAETMGAGLDDIVTLSSPTGGRTTARVVGIFKTGVAPVDYSRAYMLTNSAQTLLDKKNVINRITIRTDDYPSAEPLAAQVESLCGYRTESWQESNANFLKIFRINRIITMIIMLSLMIVAAFGVLNILIMAVLERVNDIAILRSFGLTRRDITWVFVIQGLLIGVLGSLLGLLSGKAGIEILRRIPVSAEGLISIEGLLMSEYPALYIEAFVAAMVITMLAAVYPARRAAGYDPVEVIRGAH